MDQAPDVGCATCGASSNEPCMDMAGRDLHSGMHRARLDFMRRLNRPTDERGTDD